MVDAVKKVVTTAGTSVTNKAAKKTTTTGNGTVPIGKATQLTGDDWVKAENAKYKKQILQNFKHDRETGKLELKKWYQFTLLPFSFGKERYAYHPDKGEKYGDLKNRYGIPDGYMREHGQTAQLPGNADQLKMDFDVVLDKDDLENMVGFKSQGKK